MSSTPTIVERVAAESDHRWIKTRRIDPVERAQRDLMLAFAQLHRELDAGEVDTITVDLDGLQPASQSDLDEAQAFADRFSE